MRIRNSAVTAEGKEVRVNWKAKEWRLAANYFMQTSPLLCEYEELKGIAAKDMLRMQAEVLPPEMQRPTRGFNDMIGNRAKLRKFMNIIKAEMANPTEPAAEPVRKLLPQATVEDVKASLVQINEELEQEEGESQLQFFPAVSDHNHKPAVEPSRFGSRELQKKIVNHLPPVQAPKTDMMSEIFARSMSPKAAMQAVGEMNLDTVLNLLADKVADRVADRVSDKIAERIATMMLSKSESALPAKPVAPPAPAPKPVSKVDDRPTMRQQLADAVRQMPKPKKPKIVIIGMQGHQANDIQKEFQSFEIVHLLHGNDKIKDKVANAHKVLGIEAKLGNSAKMLRTMHGSDFMMVKFSMTSIRHQLSVWETCYKEDPKYFTKSLETQAA